MEAGRELDALVARDVLEQTVYQATYAGYEVLIGKASRKYELYISTDHGWTELPFYSTDIAAAWEVVEKMRERGFWGKAGYDFGPYAQFTNDDAAYNAEADTVPMSICLAALKAVGVEVTK